MDYDQLKELVENYQPNPRVLKELGRISFLAVVGSSSSGKTTLIDMLVSKAAGFQKVLSETTRSRRNDKTEESEYLFRTKADVIDDLQNSRLVQVALFHTGDLYTTRTQSYPAEGTGVLAVQSHVIPIFRQLPFKSMRSVFIVPESYDTWQSWLHKRPVSKEDLTKRLLEAEQSYKFALNDEQMRFVLNDVPEKAAERLLQVAHGESPADEEIAAKTARDNLKKLNELL